MENAQSLSSPSFNMTIGRVGGNMNTTNIAGNYQVHNSTVLHSSTHPA
jgi:hypothetical protein